MKLHLGCGWRNFGKNWIHIDGGNYDHLDYNDITKLPFDDNSVDLIYASHVIEYFDNIEINDILLEWHRVLKKDKMIRIAVPNFEILSKLYQEGKIELNQILGPLFGRMKMGEQTIYHKTTYDFNSLKKTLEINGFYDTRKYEWQLTDHSQFDDHSQAYIPHMDKKNGVLISLNVEAKKK